MTGASSNKVAVNCSQPGALQWHSRRGHPNLSNLKTLVPSLGTLFSFECDSCHVSKHFWSSFSIIKSSRSSKLFDVIHSDIWGSLHVSNPSKFKYNVLFIDDFNRMTWLFLLHHRAEVFDTFKRFLTEIKNQFQDIPKVFHLDNSVEYKSQAFLSLLQSHAIIHETLSSYTATKWSGWEETYAFARCYTTVASFHECSQTLLAWSSFEILLPHQLYAQLCPW